MALYWFQCKNCETLIKKDSSPTPNGCPGKGSYHDWNKLAEVGDTNFQCTKCGTTIQAMSRPIPNGCTSVGSYHDWNKL